MASRFTMAVKHGWPSLRGWVLTFLEQPRFAWRLLKARLVYFVSRRVSRDLSDPAGFPIDSDRVLIQYWTLHVEREIRDAEWVTPFRDHPAPVALDVGANAGVFSHLLASLNQRVRLHAFEPLPEMARHVDAVATRMGRKITVHAAAVGDRPGQAHLNATAPNDSGASLVASGSGTAGGYEVPVVTLDESITEPEIMLIKIDTEHYELQVLKGARQVLERTRFLILEIHRADELAAIREHLGTRWRCRRITAADYLFTRC